MLYSRSSLFVLKIARRLPHFASAKARAHACLPPAPLSSPALSLRYLTYENTIDVDDGFFEWFIEPVSLMSELTQVLL